jgi:hypothetical protein
LNADPDPDPATQINADPLSVGQQKIASVAQEPSLKFFSPSSMLDCGIQDQDWLQEQSQFAGARSFKDSRVFFFFLLQFHSISGQIFWIKI